MYQGVMNGPKMEFHPVDSKKRREVTMAVLESTCHPMRIRELCEATHLRPGAQRRALRQLHAAGRVSTFRTFHWKDRQFEAIG